MDRNQAPLHIADSNLASVLEQTSVAGVDVLVAGAIVTRRGAAGRTEVLLLRRRKGRFLGGLEDLPGGKVEHNETLLEALCREVYEETGCRVTEVLGLVGDFDYTNAGRLARQFTVAVGVVDGPIILDGTEHDSFRWVPAADVVRANVSAETLHILRLWLQHSWQL